MKHSAIPQIHDELISYHIRSEGVFPKISHIAVFVYPKCVREYNGKVWVVVKEWE